MTRDDVAASFTASVSEDARTIDELAKQYLHFSEQALQGRTVEAVETLRAIEAWPPYIPFVELGTGSSRGTGRFSRVSCLPTGRGNRIAHLLTRKDLNLLTIYAGLFLWSFLAATLLPVGSEAALIAIVRTQEQVFAPVLVATIGNYLGACTTYWLGRRAAQALGKNYEDDTGDTRAARLLRRYGQPALLLSWVPFVGDALVALAGGMRLPFVWFSFWTVLGKAARYLAVTWAASVL